MDDLISRESVIEIIESVCSADDTYWQPGTLEKIRNLPTHKTPSNTLGSLDCVDRKKLTDEIWKLRRSQQMQDDTQRADLVMHGLYLVEKFVEKLPSVQPERMVLPEICILEGYDTVEDENGNKGFGVYIPSKKQIYVVGDVPQEIMLKALFHELTHWVQDISGRHFDEDEANLLAERVYEALPHGMRGDSDEVN